MLGRVAPAAGGALAAVLLLGLIAGGRAWLEGLPPFGPGDDEWSAVYLVTGEAYFGRFAATPGAFFRLRDPYTLLVDGVAVTLGGGGGTPGPAPDSTKPGSPTGVPDVRIRRVSAQAYGPAAELHLDKRRVLIVEQIRPDSQLVSAIHQDRAGR